MTTTDVIKQAIAERRTVQLEYPKHGAIGLRTCDPHILFESSTGKIQVDCWQAAGPSSSGGPLPDWRPFTVAEITRCSLTDARFEIADGYNPANRDRYVRIIAQA